MLRFALVTWQMFKPFLSFTAALCLALGGCSARDSASGADSAQRILHRGLSGEPASLDPALAGDTFSAHVLSDLYEGLTVESAGGDPLPAVAASWTTDPTGTRYTFQLRKDARWSNGKLVTASDFVTAWRRVVDPARASPVADDLRLIAGAEAIIEGKKPPASLGVSAPSDGVLVVDLAHPAPFFPQIVAHPSAFPIYSEEAAKTHDPAAWVSNGPYRLAKWQPNTAIELERNQTYWDRANVHIQRVQYQFATDAAVQYARYRSGELDLTDVVPANAVAGLRRDHSAELVIAPFLATAYYCVNLSHPALGSTVALRKALAMAIDRKHLVEALGFGQLPAYGFVPPGTWHYAPQTWGWSGLGDTDRIAMARKLYAEAGYSERHPLHLRLLINNNDVIQQTAVITAAMWKETLGVETELSSEEYKVFLQSRHDRTRWDVVRLAWTADFNDASNFLDTFRKGSVNDDSGYGNPVFDGLLDEAAVATDLDRRQELLQSAERTVLEDYPFIPLYHFVSRRLVSPRVLGVHPSPLDRLPTKSLQLVAPQ